MARHLWKEMLFTISIKISIYFSMKFHFKNMNINFATFFSPSFDVLYSSPMIHMNHTELIFHDVVLYCTKKVQENHNNFFSLLSQGETHFLVLAQTLIYLCSSKTLRAKSRLTLMSSDCLSLMATYGHGLV